MLIENMKISGDEREVQPRPKKAQRRQSKGSIAAQDCWLTKAGRFATAALALTGGLAAGAQGLPDSGQPYPLLPAQPGGMQNGRLLRDFADPQPRRRRSDRVAKSDDGFEPRTGGTKPSRVLYFTSELGLCNQIRAFFSAAALAEEEHVDLKIVTNPTATRANGYADAGSTAVRTRFRHLFAEPVFEWVDSFPGVNMSALNLNGGLMNRTNQRFDGESPHSCTVHWITTAAQAHKLMSEPWQTVGSEKVLCLSSISVLVNGGLNRIAPMYRELRPAPPLMREISEFQRSHQWDHHQWVCAHVRRTDLSLPFNGTRAISRDVISLTDYGDRLRAITDFEGPITEATSVSTRIFLATDDKAAEASIRAQLPGAEIFAFPKDRIDRDTDRGLEVAVIDLYMLSRCPVYVGTFHSTYSYTAWYMGRPYFYQIRPPL